MAIKNFLRKLLPDFLINWYHFFWSLSGALRYGFPSRSLKVIGVTGTKGKSTTVYFIVKILEEAGFKVGAVSSLSFKIAHREWPNLLKMTMPGKWYIQKMLWKAKRAGCDYFVLEVTSEGILQHRHRFINFTGAVFTNLHPEHIERHGSFENYKKEKAKLFKACKKIHIINLDDRHAGYYLNFPSKEKYGYNTEKETAINNGSRFLKAQKIRVLEKGVEFYVNKVRFRLNFPGKFNISNALAAICVALSQGVDLKTCARALEKIKNLPGRMEEVVSQPFRVIVDYAHTPDSLEAVYKNLKTYLLNNNQLICVLGAAGGGRDKWKRPEMGKIASQYCDYIILTNEDPYDEDPRQILSEIKSGISKTKLNSEVIEILDRKEAIEHSLARAKENDIVVITGKGAEPWMCVEKGKKIPWDDRQIVREKFKKLYDKKV